MMTQQQFVFDTVAEDYDVYRPGYPDALFEQLRSASPDGYPVLEIGCGTGKASEGLVKLGQPFVGVEPGGAMIAQAKRRVGEGADAVFYESTFEDWTPVGGPFGLIACAQAWHWVDPAIGFPKAASLLAPGGVLALFANIGPTLSPELTEAAVTGAYAAIPTSARWRPGGGAYRPGERMERSFLDAADFETPAHRVYHRTIRYTPESFAAFHATYSDVQMLPAEDRHRLLTSLRDGLAAHGEAFDAKIETHLYWAGRKG